MALDHDGLHVLLWMRAHPTKRTLRINQSELAIELGVTRHTMSKVMSAMADAGRVVRVGKSYHNVLFRVTDPEPWLRQDGGDGVPAADASHAADP